KNVVRRRLRVVAVGKTLIQPVENVPVSLCGRIADEPCALASESPMKAIYNCRFQYRCVANHHAFAVIFHGLDGWGCGEKWLLRIKDVLQSPSPENCVLAVRRQVIIQAGNESIVVEADRGTKAEPNIVETVADGEVVSAQAGICFLKILEHVRV